MRERYEAAQIRSRKPLPDPELFYRNYVAVKDDPRDLDPRTRLLTCLYKFARHEWVGISAAWDTTPAYSDDAPVKDRISRYHLCEEFCHVRLFDACSAPSTSSPSGSRLRPPCDGSTRASRGSPKRSSRRRRS